MLHQALGPWHHEVGGRRMRFTLFCVLVLASCTKPSATVCRIDRADCNVVGLAGVRSCSAGLACVGHQCEVPTSWPTGCTAGAPVCNTSRDTCDGCSDSSE